MNKHVLTDYAEAMADYLFDYLPIKKGFKENTINSYADSLELFTRFLEKEHALSRDNLTLSLVTRESVEKFLDDLEAGRGNSVSTRNYRRSTINAFFKYLQYKNVGYVLLYQQLKSIPKKRDRKETVEYLSVEEVQSILRQPDRRTQKGRRDFALLDLLYESAARASELASLSISDFRTEKKLGSVIVLHGKGDKTRRVPLPKKTAEILTEYIREESTYRACNDNDPLFCNHSNDYLSRAGVAYILKKHADLAVGETKTLETRNIHPHIMRHSRAMHWLEGGIDKQYIKDLLGHADMSTIDTYARLSDKMKADILKKAEPEDLPKPQNIPAEPESWKNQPKLLEWLKSYPEMQESQT